MPEIRYSDLPFGITTIDTGFVRPGFSASYLIVENSEAAFVEVGTSHNIPILLNVLQEKHIPREQVKYVIVTHIHLDHAGGAGALLQHLPNARLVVHPRGARHLISPERLIKGTIAVYGEEGTKALFGEIVPIPKERVVEASDEDRVALNARELLFLDTPGHARHHICVVDEKSRGIFTGDTFGVSLREFDTEKGNFIFPTSAPVHFDPKNLHASIDRLMSYQPERMYLTHFGCLTDLPALAQDLHEEIDQFVGLANNEENQGGNRRQKLTRAMEAFFLSRLRSHGCTLEQEQMLTVLEPDLALNVQGLEVWLDKR